MMPLRAIATLRPAYQAGLRDDLATLLELDPQRDAPAIIAIAHRQAGQAPTFGARKLGELALDLDRHGIETGLVDEPLLKAMIAAMMAEVARNPIGSRAS